MLPILSDPDNDMEVSWIAADMVQHYNLLQRIFDTDAFDQKRKRKMLNSIFKSQPP
jgi:hypothetical protein